MTDGGTSPDWRDAGFYARLRGIDRTGLAWEWLRRDPDYIAWYRQVSGATPGDATPFDGARVDAHQWGIHFR
uniref:transcriptional regulator domain-containing protein n=1 Tax=uncultured Sphingomonas sp. TaxID=158754 RepID=UPI0035CC1450